MSSTKLGAILAGIIATQALGASTVQYTLEVGGNNHASDQAGPTVGNQACAAIPFFTSGTTGDGTSQPCKLTWAARVSVSGNHSSNNLAPLGVSNVVFNLEILGAGDVSLASFGLGSDSAKGFYSTVNDAAGNNCFGPKTAEAVAFPVSFSATGLWNGRVIDSYISGGNDTGGPGLTYHQYPSTLGFPGTSTCPTGTLCGAGAGYPSYAPNGCPDQCDAASGFAMAGLGYYTANPMPDSFGQGGSCVAFLGSANNGSDGLGDVAIVEGQINMTGLTNGTYKLRLTPGTGTNLIKGGFDCLTDPGAFAVAAATTNGDTVAGDEITFTISGCAAAVCTRTVAGRAIYYNNSAWDGNTPGFVSAAQENAAIAPDKSVLLPGNLASFANVISHSRGVNGLVIDLAPGVGCTALNGAINPANFSFMSGNDNGLGSFSSEAIVPTSITAVAGGGAGGSDRIYLTLPDQPGTNPPLNSKWLRITVKSNANGGDLDLASDDVFYVGFAKGKATAALSGDRFAVGSADKNQIQVNPKPSGTALITDPNDNNRDKAVGSTDVNNALLNPTSSVNGLKQITAP